MVWKRLQTWATRHKSCSSKYENIVNKTSSGNSYKRYNAAVPKPKIFQTNIDTNYYYIIHLTDKKIIKFFSLISFNWPSVAFGYALACDRLGLFLAAATIAWLQHAPLVKWWVEWDEMLYDGDDDDDEVEYEVDGECCVCEDVEVEFEVDWLLLLFVVGNCKLADS